MIFRVEWNVGDEADVGLECMYGITWMGLSKMLGLRVIWGFSGYGG